MILPIILSGGQGKRLWPLSRQYFPKQLQHLLGQHSLLQQTILRLQQLKYCAPPLIISHRNHRYLIEKQLEEIQCIPTQIILESKALNTATACALAALWAKEHLDNPILMVIPSDHKIEDIDKFSEAIEQAIHYLKTSHPEVTLLLGIEPSYPSTHFGYIKANKLGNGIYTVEKFIEKPEKELATHFFNEGKYFWNSGISLSFTDAFISKLHHYAPLNLEFARQSLESSKLEENTLHLQELTDLFCPNISLDHALLEKNTQLMMVLLDSEWLDIGNWNSLYEASQKDQHDNVTIGDVTTLNTQNCYIHSSTRLVTAVGLNNKTIIDTRDALLVLDNNKTLEVGDLVDQLMAEKRKEVKFYPIVMKPWGSYEVIYTDASVQIKKLILNPGAQISTQLHQHRSEHWIILAGQADVLKDTESLALVKSQSTYIPVGIKHRLANEMKEPLELIEIQMGNYLDDDDIIRFEDKYERALNEV